MSTTYRTAGSRKMVSSNRTGDLYRGSQELPDTGVVWDDLRFPASALNPPGAVSDPDIDTTTGCFLFDDGSVEQIVAQVQLPHAWKEGSVIVPHVHWAKSTSAAGNVLWRFRYKWCPIGEVFDAEWTELTVSETVPGTPDDNTAYRHLISSFGEVDCTGREISDMLIVQVARVGNDAADTYGADAVLGEFDIHIQLDARGSDAPFTKGKIA